MVTNEDRSGAANAAGIGSSIDSRRHGWASSCSEASRRRRIIAQGSLETSNTAARSNPFLA